MSDNETFSGGGKKGEEEFLEFDFEESFGKEFGDEEDDFPSDEEILELVDVVEPAADFEDSESDDIAKLLEEEPVEKAEEKEMGLELGGRDEPQGEDSSQILESDIGSILDDMESSEGEMDEGEKFFEDSESDEIARLLEEEPVEEAEEKEMELELEGMDQPQEEDSSQILESDIGSVLEDMEASEGEADKMETPVEDEESDEIARLLGEEAVEEEVEAGEEELDLEELEQIPEEDATQAFEADLDTTLASMEPVEEVDAELQLDEDELESIYDDEALGVSKLAADELEGAQKSPEPPAGEEETPDLAPEEPPEIPYEDLSEVSEAVEEAFEEDMLAEVGQELPGISEERMEAIVREVVEDVVGRVARETMVTVAENVIKSAIDALKESIESSRD